tara:strand:- start:442 stop:717 length:276 start_codon:yes stop_codon:yes gene_type:complete
MNFNFDINKKEKILKVTISLIPRRFAREPKRSVGYKTVMKVIKENLDLPNTFTLGKCANPGVNFDNYSGGECSATWTFELIQMKKLKKGDV